MAETATQQATATRGRGIRLFRIAGIDIRLDYSWFFIFLLVLWALIFGYFPYNFPGNPVSSYWIAGITSAILLFASILAHELMHSFVAIQSGIRIPDITFFVFGGVSRISQDAKDPMTELRIAAAGPLTSFLLALVFLLVRSLLEVSSAAPLTVAVFGYLGWINILLGVFNLIPAFPLDGGRIFRSLMWLRTKSLTRATRTASDLGKGFAWALMFFGAFEIFAGGLLGGIWLIFIGMFLRGMAERGYQELVIRQSIEGVHVREVMTHDVVSVPRDLPLNRLIDDYFFKFCYRSFPVTHGDKVEGIVTLGDIKDVPEQERDRVTAGEVMEPLSEGITIAPEASLAEALRKLTSGEISKLVVLENGTMHGMLSKAGLFRFLQIRQILKP